jgi:apolipoprotein D and lipocalin family protein
MTVRIQFIFALMFSIFFSCATIPKGAIAVQPFDQEKYLGKWYEIARMDFKFEENLNNTTATYSLNENGSIKVDNRGYNYVTKEWQQSAGKAKFLKDPNVANLKVSFFGPFYAGYNVIAIDPYYQYALVVGKNIDYMWILSRENTIPQDIKEGFITKAKEIGFKTDELVWVEHNEIPAE